MKPRRNNAVGLGSTPVSRATGCAAATCGTRARLSFLWLLGLAAAVLTAGCQHVKPWQRGSLADPIMQADRDPLGIAFAEHIYFSREAASGGRGVGGGGCGCN